ncbi:LOW QUALITY PROTEIN: spermatogenesis-associated protein 32 [Rhynchocyon petersi]
MPENFPPGTKKVFAAPSLYKLACPIGSDLPTSPFQRQLEQDEMDLEKELLDNEVQSKTYSDLDPNLDSEEETDLETKLSEPEPVLDTEAESKVTDESPYSYKAENLSLCNLRSNSSSLDMEKEPVSTNQRSICAQTPKHLFWAEKELQVSEHSIKQALSRLPSKTITAKPSSSHTDQKAISKETPCFKNPQTQRPKETSNTGSQMMLMSLNPHRSSSSSFPMAIDLPDLVNCAPSLVTASSSKELPSLIKAHSHEAVKPSLQSTKEAQVAQPTRKEPGLEKPNEVLPEKPPKKPLEAGEPQNIWNEKHKSFPDTSLDFNKPGIKKTITVGEVKFLQPPNLPPPPQGEKRDSVPGTKKRNPLLLKIHFKLSSPFPTEMTRKFRPIRRHSRAPHAQADLSLFCEAEAERISGLFSRQLARRLHRLHKAGPHPVWHQEAGAGRGLRGGASRPRPRSPCLRLLPMPLFRFPG